MSVSLILTLSLAHLPTFPLTTHPPPFSFPLSSPLPPPDAFIESLDLSAIEPMSPSIHSRSGMSTGPPSARMSRVRSIPPPMERLMSNITSVSHVSEKVSKLQDLVEHFDRVALTRDENGNEFYDESVKNDVLQLCDSIRRTLSEEEKAAAGASSRRGGHNGSSYYHDSINGEYSDSSSFSSSRRPHSGRSHTTSREGFIERRTTTTETREEVDSGVDGATSLRWKVDFNDDLPFLRERGMRKGSGPNSSRSYSKRTVIRRDVTSEGEKGEKKKKTKKKKKKPQPQVVTVINKVDDGRLSGLKEQVEIMADTLRTKIERQRLREEESELDIMRIRDVERGKYLSLLQKLEEMHQVQHEQRMKLRELMAEQEKSRLLLTRKEHETRTDVTNLVTLQSRETDKMREEREERERRHAMEMNRLIKENRRLEELLHRTRNGMDTRGYEMDTLMKDKTSLKDQLQNSQARNNALERENKDLRDRLNDLVDEYEETVESKETYKDRLRNKKDIEYDLRKQLAEALEKCEDLERAGYALRRAIARGGGETMGGKMKRLVLTHLMRYYKMKYRAQLEDGVKNKNRIVYLDDELERVKTFHEQEMFRMDDLLRKKQNQLSAEEIEVLERYRRGEGFGGYSDKEREEMEDLMRKMEIQLREKRKALRKAQLEVLALKNSIEEKERDRSVDLGLLRFSQYMHGCFQGDYLLLRDKPVVLNQIYAHGCDDVLFSDYISLFNGFMGREKEHILAVTNKGIYIFTKQYQLKRQIKICDLKSLSLSRRRADLVIIHHVCENDQMFVAPKRPEVMYHFLMLFEKATGRRLEYKFGERVYEKGDNMMHRDVLVPHSQRPLIGRMELVSPHHRKGGTTTAPK